MTSEPTGAAMSVAVVIPHYDDLARLSRCLTALTTQDFTGVEIVVADNATPGGLRDLPVEFPQVRFVVEPEKGAATARNAAVAATTAPWIAFLDADCVPGADWLARVRDIADGAQDVVIGGRIVVFDETPPPRSGAEAFEAVFAFDQERYIMSKGFSVTANLLTARSTFTSVGPFVPGVSEDLEWCYRATAAGYRLRYDPSLCVAHPSRSDWPELRRKWRRLTEESYALQSDGARSRLFWAFKALAMPPSAIWHLPRFWRHPDLSTGERLSGSAILVRLRIARMVWMLTQALIGSRDRPGEHDAKTVGGAS